MMKKLVSVLALVLAFAGSLSAQVSVEVLMSQDQFVANEAMPVRVRIINHSGQTILFGKEDWLSYSVEAKDGQVVFKTGEPAQPHDFDVKSSEMATTPAVNLEPCFTLNRPGRYKVKVAMHIKDWNRTVTSEPATFDVVRGVQIWQQEFGVPQSPTNHNEPEIRKYILQQATMSRNMRLYLRVTDALESTTYRVVPIGPMISFGEPRTRVDKDSNLHLLYQQGAHSYGYLEFTPKGELTLRQTYDYASSAPRLDVDDTGNVGVAGGVRHIAENDFPSSRPSLTNVIAAPAP